MRTFGENLRELRKSRGYSQEKFAEVIGTKQVNVSAWELGTRVPYLATIRGIAETFKVPLSSLISIEQTGLDEDYISSVSEAIKTEPKLREILDKILYMPSSDLDALLGIINAMTKK
jgi:transcriptional regulator with XRE-family HTH domain